MSNEIEVGSTPYITGDFLPVGIDLGTSAIKIVNPIGHEKRRILSK
jgi:hypothetical protein